MSLIWLGMMTYLSHQSGAATAQESYRWARLVQTVFKTADVKTIDQMLRHLAHVFLFMIYTVLMCGAGSCIKQLTKYKKTGYAFAAFPFFWSWFDEFTKPMVPGRHNDIKDVLLNLLGCAIGVVLAVVISKRMKN